MAPNPGCSNLSRAMVIMLVAAGLHILVSLAVAVVYFLPNCNVSTLLQIPRHIIPFYNYSNATSPTSASNLTCSNPAQCFRNAAMWADDEKVPGFEWNPLLLVLVFEWVTATFSVSYILHSYRTERARANQARVDQAGDDGGQRKEGMPGWIRTIQVVLFVWTITGIGLYIFAIAVKSRDGVLQHVICLATLFVSIYPPILWSTQKDQDYTAIQGKLRFHREVIGGRLWRIPQNVASLKARYTPSTEPRSAAKARTTQLVSRMHVFIGEESSQPDAPEDQPGAPLIVPSSEADDSSASQQVSSAMQEEMIVWRYFEYCLTAPILWVAVFSLLVVDAPAWMYITGYMCILLCNLYGIPLQLIEMTIDDTQRAHFDGWNSVGSFLFSFGSLDLLSVTKYIYLQMSCLNLLIAFVPLFYVARNAFLSSTLPWFVIFIVWSLCISYCSFGLVGFCFYAFAYSQGKAYMPMIYDLLSLTAKVSISLSLLYGYIMKPGGSNSCFQ
jgi:hypothetical protein